VDPAGIAVEVGYIGIKGLKNYIDNHPELKFVPMEPGQWAQ
jgi:hypothetical protein